MNMQEAFELVWQHAKKKERSTRISPDGYEVAAFLRRRGQP